MADTPCKHEHGAQVDQLATWVCGQCFAKLSERPRRYGMVPSVGEGSAPRQQIVWLAAAKNSDGGLTLADFLRTMAKRFVHRCRGGMLLTDAFEMALGVLRDLGDEYADPAYDWSHSGARDMADEEMTYWDHDSGAGNG